MSTSLKGTNLGNEDIQQHVFGDIMKRTRSWARCASGSEPGRPDRSPARASSGQSRFRFSVAVNVDPRRRDGSVRHCPRLSAGVPRGRSTAVVRLVRKAADLAPAGKIDPAPGLLETLAGGRIIDEWSASAWSAAPRGCGRPMAHRIDTSGSSWNVERRRPSAASIGLCHAGRAASPPTGTALRRTIDRSGLTRDSQTGTMVQWTFPDPWTPRRGTRFQEHLDA